jgi:hypothetical protein
MPKASSMSVSALEAISRCGARRRTRTTLPATLGFAAVCGLGAACDAAVGPRALVLPTGLALLAPALRMASHRNGGQGS